MTHRGHFQPLSFCNSVRKRRKLGNSPTKSVCICSDPEGVGRNLVSSPEKPENEAAGCLALDGDRVRRSPWESVAEKAKNGFS